MVIRKAICAGLSALVLASAVTVPACFAAAPADVPASAWYAERVCTALDEGVMRYFPDGLFHPNQQACVGELAEILCEAAGLGVRSEDPDESRYAPYMERLAACMVHGETAETLLTRHRAAFLISTALSLKAANPSVFTDTNSGYAAAAQEAGILAGFYRGGKLVYDGDSPLTRSQLATLYYSIRSYCASHSAAISTISAGAPASFLTTIPNSALLLDANIKAPVQPKTKKEFEQALEYMVAQDMVELKLFYPGLEPAEVRSLAKQPVQDAHQELARLQPGLFTPMKPLRMRAEACGTGTNLVLSYAGVPDTNLQMRNQAVQDAYNAVQGLYADGTVKTGMTEKERAGVYVKYLNRIADYRNDGSDQMHYAWCIFERGYGVCDAWAGALQLMLRLDGIRCWGQRGKSLATGETHEWLLAELDGQRLHIDASVDKESLDYCFAWTDKQMEKIVSWSH